ncbi:RDD family protein [Streptomyces sulphureus]|uniref:RDD family protein n=1 Tax=Streptomyces sulphureus TaxID=47758 RepID=UPI001FE11A3C|nr:RDD family protein [Streptomyces sulphureus]
MSAPPSGSTNGSPSPGFYPDPSIPGYIRYWDGSAWVPGTSRPEPKEGEPFPDPPSGASGRPAVPAPRASSPPEEPPTEGESAPGSPVIDWDDPARLHGNRPGSGASWGAEPSGAEPSDEAPPNSLPLASGSSAGAASDKADRPTPAAERPTSERGLPAPRDAEPTDSAPAATFPADAPPPEPQDATPPAASAPGDVIPADDPVPSSYAPADRAPSTASAPRDATPADDPAPSHHAPADRAPTAAPAPPDATPTDALPTDSPRADTLDPAPDRATPDADPRAGWGATTRDPAPQRTGTEGTSTPPSRGRKAPVPEDHTVTLGPAAPGKSVGRKPAAENTVGLRRTPEQPAPRPGPHAPEGTPPTAPGGVPLQAAAPHAAGPPGAPAQAAPPAWGAPSSGLPGDPGEQVTPWRPPVANPFESALQTTRPAGLGRRLAARVVDLVPSLAVAAGGVLLFLEPARDHVQGKIDAVEREGVTKQVWLLDATTGVYLAIVLAALLVLGLLWEVLPTVRWGRTPGKKLFGVRVLDVERQDPPRFGAALVRWLVYGVLGVLVVGIVNVAWCLFDRPWRQCWHDKLARTFVGRP